MMAPALAQAGEPPNGVYMDEQAGDDKHSQAPVCRPEPDGLWLGSVTLHEQIDPGDT